MVRGGGGAGGGFDGECASEGVGADTHVPAHAEQVTEVEVPVGGVAAGVGQFEVFGVVAESQGTVRSVEGFVPGGDERTVAQLQCRAFEVGEGLFHLRAGFGQVPAHRGWLRGPNLGVRDGGDRDDRYEACESSALGTAEPDHRGAECGNEQGLRSHAISRARGAAEADRIRSRPTRIPAATQRPRNLSVVA